ncbi:MAG: serine protein kinase [Planctomycetota bacterium]|nr:serine protein kinase [Planctomycetota bacterium]
MDPAPSLYDLARPEHRSGAVHAWSGSLRDYLELLERDPRPARGAWQRLHAMVAAHGSVAPSRPGEPRRWRLFDDPLGGGAEAIHGLAAPLDQLVRTLRAGALELGPERRMLLLHGPVGSAKSTIVRLLKRGLEDWSLREEGALYTFEWELDGEVLPSPLRQDPLLLVPRERRPALEASLTQALGTGEPLRIRGELDPLSRSVLDQLLQRYDGCWERATSHVRVRRLVLSEARRVGIGTFQPKDEKSQDAAELTGDVDLRRLAEVGSDSDPRAFRFDGEFCVANRGLLEFVEVLKLEVAFLYDLLGATQEQVIKPRKFQQVSIDQVILGHTNEPEYRRLQADEHMEAFRDRTLTIDVPYTLGVEEEQAIHARRFGAALDGGLLSSEAVGVLALWAVLTRLEPCGDEATEPRAWVERARSAQAREPHGREGFEGFSPRFPGMILATCLASESPRVEAREALDALELALRGNSLVTHDALRSRGREALAAVREDWLSEVRRRVQRAAAGDGESLQLLAESYLGAAREAAGGAAPAREQAQVLEEVEGALGLDPREQREFRRQLVGYVEGLAQRGDPFQPRADARLWGALERVQFIRLSGLLATASGAAAEGGPAESAAVMECEALLLRLMLQEGCVRTEAELLLREALGSLASAAEEPAERRGAA